MSHLPRRTAHSGPTLVRLLSRLIHVDAAEPASSLSHQLSQWLGWTDAIALSAALTSHPAPGSSLPPRPGNTEARDAVRVRAALANAIVEDGASGARRRGPGRPAVPAESSEATVDFAVYRHRYLTTQQTMATEIGILRGRLRKALTARQPTMAKLAMVDTVMERVVGVREQSLLASVPALLETHFERLRQAPEQAPGAWLAQFRKDMQAVLLAELDIRFEPVEGLLAALRAG